jgi:RNA polymerase sigma factor (sigma-70 family)
MEFENLFYRLKPPLKAITYRLNGHFCHFNHDDLLQEASVYLWNRFRDGYLQDKTDSYILQGCYFHLKNYIRTARDKASLVRLESLRNEEDEKIEVMLPRERDAYHDFFDQMDSRASVEKIKNNGLTSREKEVFLLLLEGMTVREVGERLGISHVRVVKLKNRIKERYRTYVE